MVFGATFFIRCMGDVSMSMKFILSSMVCFALVAPVALLAADEKAESKKAPAAMKADATAKADDAQVKGRLPAGYSKIVDAGQKQKIYTIQSKYDSQLDALKKQIQDLTAQRDAEIRGVLTADQQKKLDETL